MAANFAGKIYPGGLTEAEVACVLIQVAWLHVADRLPDSDVRRVSDHVFERDAAVPVCVAEWPASEHPESVSGVDGVIEGHEAPLECRHGGDQFKRRARLDPVGDGMVPTGLGGEAPGNVRVVGGIVCHRQYGASVGIHGYCRSPVRAGL